jgi:hypothetical protein
VDAATLGLAIIPPSVALLLEFINPIRHHFLDSSVQRDLEPFRDAHHDTLVTTVTKATRAAVGISMLALTLVSTITSGFAIIHEFKAPFWPAIFYVIIFIGILLLILRLLAGHTLFEIDDAAAVAVNHWKIHFALSRSRIVSFTIYILNLLLIIFGLIVFYLGGCGVIL